MSCSSDVNKEVPYGPDCPVQQDEKPEQFSGNAMAPMQSPLMGGQHPGYPQHMQQQNRRVEFNTHHNQNNMFQEPAGHHQFPPQGHTPNFPPQMSPAFPSPSPAFPPQPCDRPGAQMSPAYGPSPSP